MDYLIDVISGSGSCSKNRFSENKNDGFFGMDPKAFIRFHFPNDKRWQLLSTPITKDEFSSMALLGDKFFKYFKTISPDVQTLRNGETLNLKLTFDSPIDEIEITGMIDDLNDDYGLPWALLLDDPKISKGVCEISIPSFGTGYLGVTITVNNKESFGITYEIYPKK